MNVFGMRNESLERKSAAHLSMSPTSEPGTSSSALANSAAHFLSKYGSAEYSSACCLLDSFVSEIPSRILVCSTFGLGTVLGRALNTLNLKLEQGLQF